MTRYYQYDKVVAEGDGCGTEAARTANPQAKNRVYCFDNMIYKVCAVDTLPDGTFDPKLTDLIKAFDMGQYTTCRVYEVSKAFLDNEENQS